jgi:hypothetical protein
MGRVSRYKKVKAVDPTSRRGRGSLDPKAAIYDEPPDLFEQRQATKKRKERSWDNEEDRDRLLQQEALRALRVADQSEKNVKRKQPEAKRPGESMKEFKTRIRQETRLTLKEELKAMSSSTKKRKEKLKEKKMKLKEKKNKSTANGDDDLKDSEDAQEFHQSADGRLRASDLGGPSSFRTADDNVRFGDSANAPPVLNIKPKLKLKGKEGRGEDGKSTHKVNSNNDDDKDREESGFQTGSSVRKKSKKEKKQEMERIWLKSDDTGGSGGGNIRGHGRSSSIIHQGGGKPSVDEMEELRQRAQEAYKKVKEKRLQEKLKGFHHK